VVVVVAMSCYLMNVRHAPLVGVGPRCAPSQVSPLRVVADRCLTASTVHGRPYIDAVAWDASAWDAGAAPSACASASLATAGTAGTAAVAGRSAGATTTTTFGLGCGEGGVGGGCVLTCAVGCNGYAAKSSDEIGRLAARLAVLGKDSAGMWADGLDPASFRLVRRGEVSP